MNKYNVVMEMTDSTVVTEYEPLKNRSDAYQSEAALENEFIKMLTEQGYEYLKINNYVSFIKPIYYEKSKTRKYKKDLNRVENLEYNEEENRLFRKDGLELEFLYYGKDKKTIYFRNPETEKKVRYNYEFRKLSKESKDNIESEFGKQLRMNRSIQVEGAFAVIKEDMKLRKLKVRGKNSVKREIALFCIAYNFNRYISKLSKNKIGTVLHSLKSA